MLGHRKMRIKRQRLLFGKRSFRKTQVRIERAMKAPVVWMLVVGRFSRGGGDSSTMAEGSRGVHW